VLLLWESWKTLKIKTQEVTITRFVCGSCNIFLGKDLDKISDYCPRCKTKIDKFDFTLPKAQLTHFQ